MFRPKPILFFFLFNSIPALRFAGNRFPRTRSAIANI
jgi:hypothetical protein